MKNHGNNGNQHGNQPLSQTVPTATLPQKPAETTNKPLFVVGSIADLIKQVEQAGGTLSDDAKAELEKMRSAQETLEAPKRLADAEAEVTAELPKLLESISAKHKVSFSGRKVVIVFKATPKEGEPNPLVSFGPEVEVLASKKSRTSNGKGFKSHGEVISHPEPGKEVHFGSFGAMAKALGYKMEGRANATVAITNPCTQAEWDALDSDGRKNLPTKFRIEPKAEGDKTIQHVYPVLAS